MFTLGTNRLSASRTRLLRITMLLALMSLALPIAFERLRAGSGGWRRAAKEGLGWLRFGGGMLLAIVTKASFVSRESCVAMTTRHR